MRFFGQGQRLTGTPQQLLDAVLRDQSSVARLDDEQVAPVLVMSIRSYGLSDDIRFMAAIRPVYRRFMEISAPELRLTHKNMVADKIQQGEFSINALIPFLVEESNPRVLASCMMDFVALAASEQDPLRGAREGIRMMQTVEPSDHRAAFFGGMFLLADRRINGILETERRSLAEDEMVEVVGMQVGARVQAPIVDFLLGWLEEANAAGLDVASGALAAALHKLGLQAQEDNEVVEMERILPLPTKGSELRKIKEWDCSEFARRIGPVLSRIEQAEQEPRLLPHVQKAWEIRTGP